MMGLASAMRGFFNEREGDVADALPFVDVHKGVMFLESDYRTVGFELLLDNTTFSGDYESITLAIHNTLNYLIPIETRIRVLYTKEEIDTSIVERQRECITATEPQLLKLLHAELDQQASLCREGFYTQTRCYCILRLNLASLSASPKDQINAAHDLRAIAMSSLSETGFVPSPLGDDDVVTLVHDFLNPDLRGCPLGSYHHNTEFYAAEQMADDPSLAPPSFTAQVAKTDIETADLDRVVFASGKHAKVFVLKHQPNNKTRSGMLHRLDTLSNNFYVIIDIYIHPHEALQTALTTYTNYAEFVYSLSIWKDPGTEQALQNARAKSKHSQALNSKLVQMSAAVIMFADSDKALRDLTRDTYTVLAQIPGNPFMPLARGVTDTYLALCPFSGGEHGPRISISALSAAHFFPDRGTWRTPYSDYDILLENSWGGLTGFNLMPESGNANAIVTGKSRSGKTFAILRLMAFFLARANASLYIIDKGLGYRWLVEAVNGSYIEPHKERINPFELPPGVNEPSDTDITDIYVVLRTMVKNVLPEDEATENGLIKEGIRKSYYVKKGKLPTLSLFQRTLSNLDEVGDSTLGEHERAIQSRLARAFANWTGNSANGKRFDGLSTIDLNNTRCVYFDIEEILKDPSVSPVYLTVILNRIKKAMMATTDPAFLIADELRESREQSPELRLYVDNFYTGIAKRVAGFYGLSQNFADFTSLMKGNSVYHYAFLSSLEEQLTYLKYHGLPESLVEITRHAVKRQGEFSRGMIFMKDAGHVEGDLFTFRPTVQSYYAFTSNALEIAQREAAEKEAGDLFAAVEQGLLK